MIGHLLSFNKNLTDHRKQCSNLSNPLVYLIFVAIIGFKLVTFEIL